MSVKRILLLCVAVLFGFAAFPGYTGDVISCNGFESCPEADTSALEARIAALEALLAGATRGIDSSTSQDTLSFGNSISGEAVLSRELYTTDREGNLPVCFNGAGELLPCADGVEPPPQAGLTGLWSGRMIYDRRSTGTCHDADVLLNVVEFSDSRSPEYGWKMYSVTVIRDTGGLSVAPNHSMYILNTGFGDGWMQVFLITVEMNLQFNTQGSAQGYWNYPQSDCYGQWSFTKD